MCNMLVATNVTIICAIHELGVRVLGVRVRVVYVSVCWVCCRVYVRVSLHVVSDRA